MQVKMQHKNAILRICLYSLLVITLAFFTNADSQAFSGYVYSGNSITVDRQVIYIYLSSSQNGIDADYSGTIMSVANNSCDSTDYFKLCLDNIEYDYSAKKEKITLRAFSTIPTISISRTVSKNELVVREEAVFTVVISNSGGVARNATYTDNFPDVVEVYDANGAKVTGSSVSWSGVIPRSGSKEISYKIKPKDVFKESMRASLAYFDGYSMQTAYSSEQTITAAHFLSVDTAIGKSAVYMGEPNNFTINLTNKGNDTLNATINLVFGPELKVNPPSLFEKTGNNSFRWSGELIKRNLSNTRFFSKVFFFEIKGERIGASEVISKIAYADMANTYTITMPQTKKTVNVKDRGIVIRSNLNDRIIEPNQKHTVKMWVQNLNSYTPITDVMVSTFTDFGYVPDSFIPVLQSGQQKLVIDQDFFAPDISLTTGRALNANVTYNLGGEKFFKSYKDTLSVTPVKDLTITQAASKSVVDSGESLLFTVAVTNPRTTGVNRVKVYDTVPPDFSVYGLKSQLVDMARNEKVTAYTYELTAPKVKAEKQYAIRTNTEYSDADNELAYSKHYNYNLSKETIINVIPKKFSLSLTATMPDTEFYAGHAHTVNYVVKNTDDKQIARGLVLNFALQPEFDLVDTANYSLSDLDPGETVYVSSIHKIRAKLNDSQTLRKPYFTFSNQYGDEFLYNGSDTPLNIKSASIHGPALILNKNSSNNVNNTEPFLVNLTIRNIGSEAAYADISDGSVRFTVSVDSKSEYSRIYNQSIIDPGIFELPVAVASYSYQGDKFFTGSNAKKITVINKPMVSVEKMILGNANDVDGANVKIKVTNINGAPVNAVVQDGAVEWQLDEFVGEKELLSNITFSSSGQKPLGRAVVSYTYLNRTYNVSSNDLIADVHEKTFASISKSASKSKVKLGEEVVVTVTLKNEQERSLYVDINDSDKSWSVELKPGGEENRSYKLKVKESELGSANASFKYGEKHYSISSSAVKLDITNKKTPKNESKTTVNGTIPPEKQQPSEDNIFKKIINALGKILSFKKSDI